MTARLLRRRPAAPASSRPPTSPAAAALRAASLLRGGVPSSRVWRMLGEEVGAPPVLAALAARIASGHDSAGALAETDGPEWRLLAAAWRLAERSGAPLAEMLDRIAAALVSLERLGERRSVLLAGPRATIRLVAALPIVALLLGGALGFDPFAVLLGPVGALLASLGGALLLAGVHWARSLTSRLAAAQWVAGLECELCWIALSGGAVPADALRRVANEADRFAVEWVRLSALRRDGPVVSVLRAAAALGAPAGPMLLAEADAARSRLLAELERAAERLGVRVLLPIGLCILPSFVLLGVLPVLLAVMGSLGPLA